MLDLAKATVRYEKDILYLEFIFDSCFMPKNVEKIFFICSSSSFKQDNFKINWIC